jgi:hypothetical protein
MSAFTIARAAGDVELQQRVISMAHKVAVFSKNLYNTTYGTQLRAGTASPLPFMYPLAVATEAQYESALLAGRGAPGHDVDVITDADIEASIQANWPYTAAEEADRNNPTPVVNP